jgi:hypothetical protein
MTATCAFAVNAGLSGAAGDGVAGVVCLRSSHMETHLEHFPHQRTLTPVGTPKC